MRLFLILGLIGLVVVAVLMAMRAGGPRVTHIEHRRDRDEEDRD